MPFSFSGNPTHTVAKPGVVSDGELCTVGTGGTAVTSSLSSYSAFMKPVRSATGVWSVTLKDAAPAVLFVDVKTITAGGTYLSCQMNTPTVDSSGRRVFNWTFNSAGTPTDLPTGGKFIMYTVYSESSVT